MDPSTPPRTDRDRLVSPDDPRLLARLRTGDRAAFQTLLRPLLPGLLGLAQRLCGDPDWAEDLVQETLFRAYQGIHGFRGDSSLRTWLFRIQVRLSTRPQQWQKREPAACGLAGVKVPDHLGTGPEDACRERELRDRLEEAIERLTTRQRTALHLRAVEGLDYNGIADILGSSAAAARMLVLAAREQIMRRMGRHLAP